MKIKLGKIIIFLVALIILCSSSLGFGQYSLGGILKTMVKIQVYTSQDLTVDEDGLIEKNYTYGTGFYISEDGLILTAAHVVKDASKTIKNPISCIELETGRTYGLLLIFMDAESDVALLQNVRYTGRLKQPNHIKINGPVSLAKEQTGCFCIGFPNEIHNYTRIAAISPGKILSLKTNIPGADKIKSREHVLVTDCEVVSGFSGGLLVDQSFLPIGLILASIETYQSKISSAILLSKKSYVRTIKDIRKVLEKHDVEIK